MTSRVVVDVVDVLLLFLLLLLLLLLLRRSTQMQRIEVFCAFQQQSSVLGIGKILPNFVASPSAVATLQGLLRLPTKTLLTCSTAGHAAVLFAPKKMEHSF